MKLSSKDKFDILLQSLKLAHQEKDRIMTSESFDYLYSLVWKIHDAIEKEKYDNEESIPKLKDIIIFLRDNGLVSIGVLAKWFNISHSDFYAIQSHF